MVAVDVGDQNPGDLTQVVPERRHRVFERPARLRQRPATVDHDDAAVIFDQVDVDRPQAVLWQRKRDPVHAGLNRLGTGLGPASAARALRHAITAPVTEFSSGTV
jgi:hypothetical protein